MSASPRARPIRGTAPAAHDPQRRDEGAGERQQREHDAGREGVGAVKGQLREEEERGPPGVDGAGEGIVFGQPGDEPAPEGTKHGSEGRGVGGRVHRLGDVGDRVEGRLRADRAGGDLALVAGVELGWREGVTPGPQVLDVAGGAEEGDATRRRRRRDAPGLAASRASSWPWSRPGARGRAGSRRPFPWRRPRARSRATRAR